MASLISRALIVLESGIDLADELFHLTALTVSLSILAHSSTDVAVARQFQDADLRADGTPEAR